MGNLKNTIGKETKAKNANRIRTEKKSTDKHFIGSEEYEE